MGKFLSNIPVIGPIVDFADKIAANTDPSQLATAGVGKLFGGDFEDNFTSEDARTNAAHMVGGAAAGGLLSGAGAAGDAASVATDAGTGAVEGGSGAMFTGMDAGSGYSGIMDVPANSSMAASYTGAVPLIEGSAVPLAASSSTGGYTGTDTAGPSGGYSGAGETGINVAAPEATPAFNPDTYFGPGINSTTTVTDVSPGYSLGPGNFDPATIYGGDGIGQFLSPDATASISNMMDTAPVDAADSLNNFTGADYGVTGNNGVTDLTQQFDEMGNPISKAAAKAAKWVGNNKMTSAKLGLTGLNLLNSINKSSMTKDLNTAQQQSYDKYLQALNPPTDVKNTQYNTLAGNVDQTAAATTKKLSSDLAARGIRKKGVAAPLGDVSEASRMAKNAAYNKIFGTYNVPSSAGPANYSPSALNVGLSDATQAGNYLLPLYQLMSQYGGARA